MAPGRSRTGSGGASSLMPPPLEAKRFRDLGGGLPMPHGPTQPFHQSRRTMPITLSRSGNPAPRRDQTPPSDDRSWQQTSHCPARRWRVSDRVTDTLAEGFGIRLIRTDPPESVDCSRCRALRKSQSGASGHRLAQKLFSGSVEPSGCDGDTPRPEARPTADPERSSSNKAQYGPTRSRP